MVLRFRDWRVREAAREGERRESGGQRRRLWRLGKWGRERRVGSKWRSRCGFCSPEQKLGRVGTEADPIGEMLASPAVASAVRGAREGGEGGQDNVFDDPTQEWGREQGVECAARVRCAFLRSRDRRVRERGESRECRIRRGTIFSTVAVLLYPPYFASRDARSGVPLLPVAAPWAVS